MLCSEENLLAVRVVSFLITCLGINIDDQVQSSQLHRSILGLQSRP